MCRGFSNLPYFGAVACISAQEIALTQQPTEVSSAMVENQQFTYPDPKEAVSSTNYQPEILTQENSLGLGISPLWSSHNIDFANL